MPGLWERIFNASGNRKFAADDGRNGSTTYQTEVASEPVTFVEDAAARTGDADVDDQDIEDGEFVFSAASPTDSHYADFYENAPDMFFSIEASTARIIQCNQTLVEALGYSKNELIGSLIFATTLMVAALRRALSEG